MVQENKELLLKYLCMAQPYGLLFKDESEDELQELHYVLNEDIYSRKYPHLPYWIETIKPYLRPMSSMTKEEKKEYIVLSDLVTVDGVLVSSFETFDWLLAHHFDFMGMIEKGLALDCNGLHIYEDN